MRSSTDETKVEACDEELHDATRLYLEQWGHDRVRNFHLGIAVIVLAVLNLVQGGFLWKAYQAARQQKTVYIFSDEVGAQHVLNSGIAERYEPRGPELRHFFGQFVVKHYGRMVATAKEYYAESLLFLDKKLADAAVQDERKNETLTKFLREGSEEIDIEVMNVVLQELRKAPYKASVIFDKVFYTRNSHRETHRERYEATFEFVILESVPNIMIPTNPLGLIITYVRTDQAWGEQK